MSINEAMNLLELKPGFTEEELKKNYRKLMRQWHPDTSNDPNAEEMAKKINEANELLKQRFFNNGNKRESFNQKYTNTEVNINNLLNKRKIEIFFEFKKIVSLKIGEVGFYDFLTQNIILELHMIVDKATNIMLFIKDLDLLEQTYNYTIDAIFNSIRKYILSYCSKQGWNYKFGNDNSIIIDNKYEVNYKSNILDVYHKLQEIEKDKPFLEKNLQKIKKLFK